MSFLFINLKKDITFNFSYNFELSKSISWKTSTGSEYWWQVKGCCKNIYQSSDQNDVCPPIKINRDCTDKSQYIQVLLSPSIQNLCEDLKSNNWNWKLCSVERWSRPAENEFVTAGDECNILEFVDYKNVLECLSLSLDHEIKEKIKFRQTVTSIVLPLPKISDFSSDSNLIHSSAYLKSQNSDYLIEEKINFGFYSIIKEFSFSERYSNQYIPNLTLVQVPCADCFDLPNILYIDNNLTNLNIVSSFLYKNNYEISDEIPIKFNKTTGLWSSVSHYSSKFTDEKLKVIFDLGCTSEEESDRYFWKFSISFFYEKNKTKKETRLSLGVPDKFVCAYSKDNILNFKYNIKNKYLFINYFAYYDNFYFIDNIGLFKSNYWNSNPNLAIKITKDKIKDRINKKTIYY